MKVYIVTKVYCNTVDAWESIVEVFSSRDKSEYRVIELEELNTDDYVNYYIQTLEVQ